MQSVTLYEYKSEDIRISIEAYFRDGSLIIDGYDIGKRVEEYWGDSDYEYVLTIPPQGIDFLYSYFKVNPGNKDLLLQTMAVQFNSNSCYSDIRKLLDDNHIPCEGFTW